MRDDGMGCLPIIALAIFVFVFWKWNDGRGPWTGWIYPDANDTSYSIKLGEFKNFEACQEASIEGVRTLSRLRDWSEPEGTYECGRRCRFDKDLRIDVCKETRD